MKLMKREIMPLVNQKTKEQNLTKSEISSVCNDFVNEKMKKEMESVILSFLFLALQNKDPKIGTGDIVASRFRTGLTDEMSGIYLDTNTIFTKIFNEMVNGSLPGSIFQIPKFFATPDKGRVKKIE